jgi:hypothetical protein
MDTQIKELIYKESGGFAGLQRGCTVEPQALPDTPRAQLQSLLVLSPAQTEPLGVQATAHMPDMLVYTLEIVMQPSAASNAHKSAHSTDHRMLQYPADDVPSEVTDLIEFLQTLAQPQ